MKIPFINRALVRWRISRQLRISKKGLAEANARLALARARVLSRAMDRISEAQAKSGSIEVFDANVAAVRVAMAAELALGSEELRSRFAVEFDRLATAHRLAFVKRLYVYSYSTYFDSDIFLP